jgi:hypothetical protein
MRCLKVIAAAALIGAAAAPGQQPGPNIVPQTALNGAVRRAFTTPVIPPPGPAPSMFRLPNINLMKSSTPCAVPLLEAKVAPTHDRIARRNPDASIDPKMSKAPAIPACPAP